MSAEANTTSLVSHLGIYGMQKLCKDCGLCRQLEARLPNGAQMSYEVSFSVAVLITVDLLLKRS